MFNSMFSYKIIHLKIKKLNIGFLLSIFIILINKMQGGGWNQIPQNQQNPQGQNNRPNIPLQPNQQFNQPNQRPPFNQPNQMNQMGQRPQQGLQSFDFNRIS